MLAPNLVLVLCCGSDALVALSGAGIRVLLLMEQREGGLEDLRGPSSLCRGPHGVWKGAHVLLLHVATGSCCPLRSRMLSQYATPVPMANVARSMVGPVRIVGTGIGSSSCVGWGDPRSNHGENGWTLDI